NKEVVGITKFCVHPHEAIKTKSVIGGTKKLNMAKIRSFKPDLILANKEENSRDQIEEFAKDFPVWVSDVKTLEDAVSMILSVGEITGKKKPALSLKSKICNGFNNLKAKISNHRLKKSVYIIWHNPMMSIGNDTFIHSMMQHCGFENALSQRKRYPEISEQELAEINPELIMLSSEPFPFREKHIARYRLICPAAKIILVDGQMFSWYGSRLQYAPEYFLWLFQSINK
ncbi:MAG: ABC transporter substrate-binding protein, partial [Bacteroidia bacterium]|nr:ABC transporter substrate-binding protein [Bacteroidia bacterium]